MLTRCSHWHVTAFPVPAPGFIIPGPQESDFGDVLYGGRARCREGGEGVWLKGGTQLSPRLQTEGEARGGGVTSEGRHLPREAGPGAQERRQKLSDARLTAARTLEARSCSRRGQTGVLPPPPTPTQPPLLRAAAPGGHAGCPSTCLSEGPAGTAGAATLVAVCRLTMAAVHGGSPLPRVSRVSGPMGPQSLCTLGVGGPVRPPGLCPLRACAPSGPGQTEGTPNPQCSPTSQRPGQGHLRCSSRTTNSHVPLVTLPLPGGSPMTAPQTAQKQQKTRNKTQEGPHRGQRGAGAGTGPPQGR